MKKVYSLGMLVVFWAIFFNISISCGDDPVYEEPTTSELVKLIDSDPELKSNLIASLEKAYAINPDPKTNPGAQGETGEEKLLSYYDFVDSAAQIVPNQITDNPPDLIRDQILQTICVFYFLVDQPLASLEGKGYFKPAIQYVPKFSNWLRDFANAWGSFLDTEKSWTAETYENFSKDPKFRINDYIGAGDWESWKSFNQFFSRYFKPGKRPIAEPLDETIITSPADSVPQGVWQIDQDSNIVVENNAGIAVKNLKYYNVNDLLAADSPYKDEFKGGKLTHTFLNVYDYHRYHFPVGGTVLSKDVIQQNVALEVSWDSTEERYVPIDSTGWQFTQTRGVVILNTKAGLVAVIPMGMAHVSSVNFEPSVQVGATVKKGDMLGTFLFGGSDFIILFQEQANFELNIGESSETEFDEIQLEMLGNFPNTLDEISYGQANDYPHILARTKYGTVETAD